MNIIGETIITWTVTFILGTLVGFLGTKLKKYKAKEKEETEKDKKIEVSVQALLRNDLIRLYREYKSKGEMTILDKENVDHLYSCYIDLGGNGTVKELYEDLSDLDIKIIKE